MAEIKIIKSPKATQKLSIQEAMSVYGNVSNNTAETLMNAAEVFHSIRKDASSKEAMCKNAAMLAAESYNLTYDPDNIELTPDGTEMLMWNVQTLDKFWVKITPESTDADINACNDKLREMIFTSCPAIGQICQATGLKISFVHNRALEDSLVNSGAMPSEIVEFFTSKQLNLLFPELKENKVRPYDGQQTLKFNKI